MSEFTPVARLKDSLVKAKSAPVQQKTCHVWSKVFNYDADNKIEVYEASIEFYRLVECVEESVASLCGSEALENLYRKQYLPIKRLAMTFSSPGDWAGVKKNIDDAMLLNIEHSKLLYDEHVASPEVRVDDSYLEELMRSTEDLFDKVFYSNLPRDLRLKILDDVVVVKRSISRYAFHGRDGVERSMAMVLGRVSMNGDVIKKDENVDVRESVVGLFTSFWGFMNASNVASQFIENARDALKYLSSSGGG